MQRERLDADRTRIPDLSLSTRGAPFSCRYAVATTLVDDYFYVADDPVRLSRTSWRFFLCGDRASIITPIERQSTSDEASAGLADKRVPEAH